MKTEFLPADEKSIEYAASLIRSGNVVIFPTETVYGIGASALSDQGIAKIYAAKGRPSNNPLIAHIHKPEDAERYIYTDKRYYAIAEAFMPGPVTVIMKSRGVVACGVSAGLDTLAVRCPAHEIASRLILESGVPIAAPSANISGRPSPTTAPDAMADMDGRVPLIIDGGRCSVGIESTIIKLDEGGRTVLLRPGIITPEMLAAVIGADVLLGEGLIGIPKSDAIIESPGQLYKHYAPAVPLFLVSGEAGKRREFMLEKQRSGEAALLIYDDEARYFGGRNTVPIGSDGDCVTQAQRLFAALREAERMGVREIYAPKPDPDGVGLALLNRMLRAAAFQIVELDG